MKVRVGINGMGRIGRAVLRSIVERDEPGFEVVAIKRPLYDNEWGYAQRVVDLLELVTRTLPGPEGQV